MRRLGPFVQYTLYLLWPAALAVSFMALGFATWRRPAGQEVALRARLAEAGGWAPASVRVRAGEPVTFRLTADDMDHGFAIGQVAGSHVDLPLGERRSVTVTFDQPGKYVFYCTRWCSAAHWRMRGVIEVAGAGEPAAPAEPPLYVQLELDLDAPRAAPRVPLERPSAARGAAVALTAPEAVRALIAGRAHSPAAVWQAWREDPAAAALTEQATWDAVAWLWREQTAPAALTEAGQFYADNCAACHGERGDGQGPFAPALTHQELEAQAEFGAHTVAPSDFTDLARMLAASPALLQGKLLRGGMGTGMPYWGPIFTEAQTWALTDWLWTFVFDYGR